MAKERKRKKVIKTCPDCGKIREVEQQWPASRGIKCPDCRHFLPGNRAAFNRVLSNYKLICAKPRGHSWELTDAEFFDLTQQDCHYCGIEPGNINIPRRKYRDATMEECFIFNGIDRMDNDLGYTLDNCVSCCSLCNRNKGPMNYEKFFAWIHRIAERHP